MPTIRRCCIVGCQSNSREEPQLQFFSFPRIENPLHRIWKQACQASLSRILPFKKPVVCAYHFGPKCIGGRRLVGNAIPTLRLEVPSNLKASETQAMLEEIERSRKCAYINAVVYEWLVRANLNHQLRGSITHGMIKEKAENARQIIGSDSFVADNRWLNRFRETHLINFSQKLSTNQLKPLGPSLWIPEIVQDLQHLYPPATPERVSNLENVPEQYINYMHQYGEHAEDDDPDSSMDQSYDQKSQNMIEPYEQKPQLTNGFYEKPQIMSVNGGFQQQPGVNGNGSYHQQPGMNGNGNFQQPMNGNGYNPLAPPRMVGYQENFTVKLPTPPQRPQSQPRPNSASPHDISSGQNQYEQLVKRLKSQHNVEEPTTINGSERAESRTSASSPAQEIIEDLTDNAEANSKSPSPQANVSPTQSSSTSPTPFATNGVKEQISTDTKDLSSYKEALEYLKPLEEFALFRENFRAIGLISQLEMVLLKGGKTVVSSGEA